MQNVCKFNLNIQKFLLARLYLCSLMAHGCHKEIMVISFIINNLSL